MSGVKKSDLQKVAVINDAGVVIKIMYTSKDQDIEDKHHIIISDSEVKSPIKVGDYYTDREFYRCTSSKVRKRLIDISKDIESSDIAIKIVNEDFKYSDIKDKDIKTRVDLILDSYVDLGIITKDQYTEETSEGGGEV